MLLSSKYHNEYYTLDILYVFKGTMRVLYIFATLNVSYMCKNLQSNYNRRSVISACM